MEQIRTSLVVTIDEATKVAAARRAAHDLCIRLGLDNEVIARAELIAVELANNVLHHARNGQVLLTPGLGNNSVEIIAVDRGPGIASLARAMQDGYSSAGTLGLGLGSLKRMAQHFDLYSAPGKGTVMAAVVGSASGSALDLQGAWPTSALSVPIQGETLNGDSWAVHTGPARTVYLMVDGLGHGFFAAEASALATRIFLQTLDRDPQHPLADLLNKMHGPLHATRGAAIAMFSIDRKPETEAGKPTSFRAVGCGVGNISCLLQAPDGSTHSVVSHNGTVGYQMRRVQEFPFTVRPGTLLFMHTDGLSTHWKLSQYPGIERNSPAVLAGILFRDMARPRDDASILVARIHPDTNGRSDA